MCPYQGKSVFRFLKIIYVLLNCLLPGVITGFEGELLFTSEIRSKFDFLVFKSHLNLSHSSTYHHTTGAIAPLENIYNGRRQSQNCHRGSIVLVYPSTLDEGMSILSKILRFDQLVDLQNFYFIFWPTKFRLKTEALESNLESNFLTNVFVVDPSTGSSTLLFLNATRIFSPTSTRTLAVPLSLSLPIGIEDLHQALYSPVDFENVSLNVLAEDFQTLYAAQLETRTVNGSFQFVRGYTLEIIEFLGAALNFSIVPVKGKGFILPNENGSLTGQGLQLLRGEGDISITPSELLVFRKEQLTFLLPTFHSFTHVYLVVQPSSHFRDVYYHSFHPDAWLFYFAFWFLVCISIKGMHWLKSWAGTDPCVSDEDISKDAVLLVVGAACQQGWYRHPTSFSLRIVVIVIQLTSIVCFVAFNAALVSSLSMDEDVIHHPQDIAKYKYKVYSDKQEHGTHYFVHQLEGRAKDDPELPHRIVPMVEAFQHIYSEQSAVLSIPDSFYPNLRQYLNSRRQLYTKSHAQVDEQMCREINSIRVARLPTQTAMFLRKHSPLQPYFNNKIVLMIERGIKDRYTTTFFRKRMPQCNSLESGPRDPLGLKDTWTAFVLLFIGFISSFLLLLVENWALRLLETTATDRTKKRIVVIGV